MSEYETLAHENERWHDRLEKSIQRLRRAMAQSGCGGSGQRTYHRDDYRGPEFNSAPDSTAGGGISTCPGCPECRAEGQPK